jgi:hypothetical protein
MSTLIKPDNLDGSMKIADGYSRSARVLMKHVGQTRSSEVVHSMVVLHALALEIYLRCLYALDRDGAYEGHHLKQIFDALGEETRRKVTEYYDRNVEGSEFIRHTHAKHQEMKGRAALLDIEHVLGEWGDALAEWKYFFMPEHKVSFLAFGEMEKALLQRIGELRESRGTTTGGETELAA